MNCLVLNKSSVMKDADIQAMLPAWNVFVGHVRTWWPRPFTLVWCPVDKEPKTAWKLVIADTSDEAGALGYHDFTPDGRPISFVFAKDDIDNGYDPSVTATHEIAEMIADPWISELFQVGDKLFAAKEVADACEADELGYEIKVDPYPAIMVSDFVLPKWFIPGSTGKFDRQGHVSKPLELLPGGYMSWYIPGKGWTQTYADKGGEVKSGADPAKKGHEFSRLYRYGRDRGTPQEVKKVAQLVQ